LTSDYPLYFLKKKRHLGQNTPLKERIKKAPKEAHKKESRKLLSSFEPYLLSRDAAGRCPSFPSDKVYVLIAL